MRSESKVTIVFDHMPEARIKMMVEGRKIIAEVLEDLARDIEASGPYRGILKAKADITLSGGQVDVSPWWMGFIEFGSTTHAARPFVEPASNRAFREVPARLKAIGESL